MAKCIWCEPGYWVCGDNPTCRDGPASPIRTSRSGAEPMSGSATSGTTGTASESGGTATTTAANPTWFLVGEVEIKEPGLYAVFSTARPKKRAEICIEPAAWSAT